jgi:hypothetical protein
VGGYPVYSARPRMRPSQTIPARRPAVTRFWPSLFLAGFECATGWNAARQWIDQIVTTQHDRFLRDDYRRLVEVGIRAVREGIRWPVVDRADGYDFGSVAPFVEAGREFGIVQIWDLFHYGYPDGLDPFSPAFAGRFAEYCAAVARYLRPRLAGTPYFTPVNEISYFSWAGGHAGLFAPHATDRGWELKVALSRAAIAGIDAIREILPEARMVNADPICHVVAPVDRPDLAGQVDRFNHRAVMEGWDMLAGRLLPELGGSREHLDIVGVNYYWTNQWELERVGVPLAEDDPRRLPLRDLVTRVWERYGGEIMIAETSHVNEHRGPWVRQLGEDVRALWERGVPLSGVCLYPILGMPEWHMPQVYTRLGLWDLHPASPTLRRVVCPEMLAALQQAQALERHPTWRAAQSPWDQSHGYPA